MQERRRVFGAAALAAAVASATVFADAPTRAQERVRRIRSFSQDVGADRVSDAGPTVLHRETGPADASADLPAEPADSVGTPADASTRTASATSPAASTQRSKWRDFVAMALGVGAGAAIGAAAGGRRGTFIGAGAGAAAGGFYVYRRHRRRPPFQPLPSGP